ncbi:MAG: DnaK suppressor protein [Gammaproteobacteria bacterium]|jgi:DnaK suppressor protein
MEWLAGINNQVNTTNTEKFKAQLIQLKAEIEEIQKYSHESTKPVELDQAKVGRLSRMDAMQGQQMAKETSRRREIELLAIGGALRRLESGDFGNCSVCDEEIDIRRLTVNPTSTRCIKCVED